MTEHNGLVLQLAREVEKLAGEQEYWPGFRPIEIPLTVYDTLHTYVFRCPTALDGFVTDRWDDMDVLVYPGRHPNLVANTSARFDGVWVATLMFDPTRDAFNDSTDLKHLAGVAIHEAFHVYQNVHHPDWQANTASLFTFPFDDVELLTHRRLETDVFRRSLAAGDATRQAGWAKRALEARWKRFERMESEHVEFERGLEVIEGLATYVEASAVGTPDVVRFPDAYRVDDVRRRSYASGHALATLLDTFDPSWKKAFDASDRPALDLALEEALASAAGPIETLEFSDRELSGVRDTARRDVERYLRGRTERRKAFETTPGRRLVIRAAQREPLRIDGLDPSNVEIVDGGVLHSRYFRMHNERAELELMARPDEGPKAMTVGVGPHPLFSGIAEVVVIGLDDLDVRYESEERTSLTLTSQWFNARLTNAVVLESRDSIVVRLT